MSPVLWTVVGVAGRGGSRAGRLVHIPAADNRRFARWTRVSSGRICAFTMRRRRSSTAWNGWAHRGRARMRRLWLADTGLSVALLAVMLAAANNSVSEPCPPAHGHGHGGLPAHFGGPCGKCAACLRRARISRTQADGSGARGRRCHGGQVVPDGAVGGRPVRRTGAAGRAPVTRSDCQKRGGMI